MGRGCFLKSLGTISLAVPPLFHGFSRRKGERSAHVILILIRAPMPFTLNPLYKGGAYDD